MSAEQQSYYLPTPYQRQGVELTPLLQRHPDPILERNLDNAWEAGTVFNPSVIRDAETGKYQMFYRATNGRRFWKPGEYTSSIGYAESKDGIEFARRPEPLVRADQPWEIDLGCEDPRVTKFGDEYFIFYTAVQGPFDTKRDRMALATTLDLQTIEKHGIIGPDATAKAGTLFPEKIGGNYTMLYTLYSDTPQSSILLAEFPALEDVKRPPDGFMEDNARKYEANVVFPSAPNAHRGPEVGAPPVRTKDGWLLVYTGINLGDHDQWTIDAALLAHNNPRRIIAHTIHSLLSPATEKETRGNVKNVVFPTAAIVDEENDELAVYYGSGDEIVSMAKGKLSRVMGAMEEVK